jgi:two-component system CheB/CheR fusion protein
MDRFPFVGIVSSAGDLEAVSELLSALPSVCGAAFIIVQHLDSAREISFAANLSRRTTFPVVHVQEDVVLERDHVYVIGANAALTVNGDSLSVKPRGSGLHGAGDALLVSLAAERGDDAIGVVLSGGGSDGAVGIQAIKRTGGATFAQYPGSARFPSMPISAIDTGCVDRVLRPNEIALELARLSRHAALLAGHGKIAAVGSHCAMESAEALDWAVTS